MWVFLWLFATVQWVGLAYLIGHWRGTAAANQYHVDRMIRHEREAHGR